MHLRKMVATQEKKTSTMRKKKKKKRTILFLLIYSLAAVSCEHGVAAPVGGSVLLPCLLANPPANALVFWRDKDDSVVLDIKGDADDLQTQSQKFRGRVFGDRKRYKAGNFSILLTDVRQADAGVFECHVPSEDFQKNIRLTVSGEGVEATPSGAAPPVGSSWFFFFFSLSLIAG
ncbi:uncharacterized protein [Clinocottus analis]